MVSSPFMQRIIHDRVGFRKRDWSLIEKPLRGRNIDQMIRFSRGKRPMPGRFDATIESKVIFLGGLS
jgi:hypothetical protein